MNESKFLKNPVLRNKFECELVEPCGNSLEEIKENAVVGGVTPSTIFGSIWSVVLGNKGYVCTWTVECQSNCS